ncbi:PadR family transcriptional regulator [Sphingomonas japonica]|uniref:DNA-binding PadR family transcriptional regulator n=1 Tax=Sphingomonas japonica TaxID=511662 RepID=A0ABX0U0W2_9SPHN|nr:PadR family transcriptional regulator [Sphingomonas japonica]NIJ24159.1 DNA-binding PadR family transcriptional regulator [Sphingomonas japonica]
MSRLLAALHDAAPGWVHGYDLMKRTDLMSGTLYPLLIRMAEQDLVESEWQDAAQPGRPQRHAYRLTAKGIALARAVRDDAPLPSGAKSSAA